MNWLTRLFRKEQTEKHLDAELRDHLDRQIVEYLAEGISLEEARRRAKLEFGGLERVKEEVRDTRWETHLDNLFLDFRYAIRNLRKDRRFALVAMFALALGIGASTAIFSVVNAALLRPLPYRDPARLVWADEFVPHINDWAVPNPEFTNWRIHNHTFEVMGAYDGGSQANLTGAGEPERIETSGVTTNFFAVLGIQPALGRVFLPDEDRPGGPLTVLLTDSLWRRKFSADPGIVGKSIDLDGRSYAVVGVLPASFHFPTKREAPQCLFAFQLPPEVDWAAQTLRLTSVVGRLAPGVSVNQAQADLTTLAAQSNSVMPAAFVRTRDGLKVQVTPLHQKIVGDVRSALLILLTAVLLVLLIACVNVANLQLVRTAGRHKEMAVRVAIGAGRARLIQQLVTEGVSLATLGGSAGLLLAAIGVRLLRSSLPASIAQIGVFSIDRRVLLFALIITCLTAILFGLTPAFRGSKPVVNDALKEGGSRTTGFYIRRGPHGALVAVEFTLAFLLLIGSGLLIRSFIRLSKVAPGFDPANVLTVSTEIPHSKYSTDEQRQAFFSQVLERVRTLPGVHSVGLTTQLPFSRLWGSFSFLIEGQPEPPPGTAPMVFANEVSSDYFQTMRIPLLTGRSFTPSDLAPNSHAIIVSAAFARRFLPPDTPLLKRVRLRGPESPWSTVVGVVGDVHYTGLDHDSDPQVYVPYYGENAASVVIRSDQDPRRLVSVVRAQFAATDPLQPVFDITTMQQRVEDSIEIPRSNMTLLSIFASLALVLAAVGIYGVISYLVSQRTHEIGIRMALGAAPSHVFRLVLGQGIVMILIGLALGLAGSLFLTRYLANLLYGVRPFDPLTIICVAVVLVLVALAACYLPARRAANVDPLIALRYE
ncbi:MAG: ABC transporter permease [Candidatus Acidiferrum sp.]